MNVRLDNWLFIPIGISTYTLASDFISSNIPSGNVLNGLSNKVLKQKYQ